MLVNYYKNYFLIFQTSKEGANQVSDVKMYIYYFSSTSSTHSAIFVKFHGWNIHCTMHTSSCANILHVGVC